MKKIIIILTVITIVLSNACITSADIKPTVKVENERFDCIISNDRTYIPMRAVFEALGYKVDWYAPERAVALTRNNVTVTLLTGSSIVTGYGELNDKVIIANDRTYLPLRELLGIMGYEVTWDGNTKTAEVITAETVTTQATTTVTSTTTTTTITEATTENTTEATTETTTNVPAKTEEYTVIEYEDFYIGGEKINNSDELRDYIFEYVLENKKPTVSDIEAMIDD